MGKAADEKFCLECGQTIKAKAVVCIACGCAQPDAQPTSGPVQQVTIVNQVTAQEPVVALPCNRGTAAALAIFLGGIGAHKFYMGQHVLGLAYLLFAPTGLPVLVGVLEGLTYLSQSDEFFFRHHFGLDLRAQRQVDAGGMSFGSLLLAGLVFVLALSALGHTLNRNAATSSQSAGR